MEKAFWADEFAEKLISERDTYCVATGISPSGHIHVGNLREVATADIMVRALKEKGKKVRFVYIADNFDPLRKVYPFLDASKFEPEVGKPLSEIPSPGEGSVSYSDYFLKPFLKSLDELDIQIELLKADELYKEGKFAKNIALAMERTDDIAKILKEITKKEMPKTWSPFVPICEKDGRMDSTKVLGFDAPSQTVEYECECGHKGTRSMSGGGKLTWRVDWPARWEMLGVTVEPFGKDHATRGGSYDTGVKIAQEIFNYKAPFPVVYEWIGLKGQGDMSSSKGNVISIADMLKVLPPEILKYWVFKAKPNKHMSLDPGLPLLTVMDEFDDSESKNLNVRASELATISSAPRLGVPFRHIISQVQMFPDSVEEIKNSLERTGYSNLSMEILEKRVRYAKNWLEKFAPDEVKFSVQTSLPTMVEKLEVKQKQSLAHIGSNLKDEMDAKGIHELIYSCKEAFDIQPKEIFAAIYAAVLGAEKGPRAGFFLASLDRGFVRSRFEEASK